VLTQASHCIIGISPMRLLPDAGACMCKGYMKGVFLP
jgi:hypothetical protein